jgi:anti-sigma factor RsiW
MIHCHDLNDFLHPLVTGTLSQELEANVEAHLRVCPRCRAGVEQYVLVTRFARELPDIPPPRRLLDRFRAALQGAPHGPRWPGQRLSAT